MDRPLALRHLRYATVVAGIVLLQSARGADSGSPSNPATDDVTKLSPFVVQTSGNDIGYYAENTRAGTRLNTSLADIAASITVVTRQQMLDTASVDMNDVFMYEANTEGPNNNYTSFAYDGTTFRDFTQSSPVTANRMRGMGAADRSHNYYFSLSQIPFDVYNTETVEINRGPNSMLFGLGSAAGIVNQSSANANLAKNSVEVGARYGSYDAFRSSLRVNHVLIPKKLAIFGAALYDRRGYERQPAYDNHHRFYGAVTYQPFSATTVRANFERFNEKLSAQNSVTPQDGVTEWKAAGSPTWNPLTFTVTRNGVATVLPNSTLTNQAALQNGNGSLPTMFINNGRVELWMQSALSPTGITGPFPSTLPQLSMSSTAIQKTQGSTTPLFNIRGVNDRSLYDWTNVNLTSGNFTDKTARVFNVEVEQSIGKNLFAQLGWYREDYKSLTRGYNTPGFLAVDTNQVLLDGTPNPYFKKLFFRGSNNGVSEPFTRNDNFRANLAYIADFRERPNFLKWFGLNRFFAFGERHELNTTNWVSQENTVDAHTWVNPAAKYAGASGVINVGAALQSWMYVGDLNNGVTNGGGFMPFGSNNIPLRYAQPVGTQTGIGTYNWVNEPAHQDMVLVNNTNATRQTDDSFTLGWQGSLLKDRIVPTLGFRRDRNESAASRALVLNPATGLLDTANINTFGPPLRTFGNTRTAGVVVKPLKFLSFSYDQSRNFTPAGLKLDIFGNPLPLPTGKGRDMGVRFNLMESKLVLNIDYYESSAKNARGTSADGFMFRVSRFETGFITWAQTMANAALGTGASSSAVSKFVADLTHLPEGYVPPPLASIGSSSTVASHGVEAQLTYNPLPNWNMKATFGRQKTSYANIAPEYDAYVTPRLPIWIAAKDPTSGTSFWSTNSSPDLGIPVNFFNANILAPIQLAQALQGKRTQGQREWSASGIMTYRFIKGPAKGFTLGGAARLQDKAIAGYYGAAPDATGVIRSLDPNRPIYDKVNPAFDFWLAKSFQLPELLGRHVAAKVQLNVKNAFEKGNWLNAINFNPDGSPVALRIVDPRTWYADVTFMF
jgi:outer membrane receptor protein involved in Fe transport